VEISAQKCIFTLFYSKLPVSHLAAASVVERQEVVGVRELFIV
jgi:hypothetical protein